MDSFSDDYLEESRSDGYDDCYKIVKGKTPCFMATKTARYEALLLLLKIEANPNITFSEYRDYDGSYTVFDKTYPLIVAVQQGTLEIVKLLLRHGANPNVRYIHEEYNAGEYSKEEYTALELAIYLKRQDIVALLEEKQAENFYYSEFSETYNDEYIDEDGRYCGTRDRCKTIRHKRDGEKIKEWNHDI